MHASDVAAKGDMEKTSKKIPDNSIGTKQWQELWDTGNILWHMNDVNKDLLKYADRLFDKQTNLRVFVPMCGKSVDMKWLALQGHTVIGVELIESSIWEFFEEQNLEYTVSTVEPQQIKVYKAKEMEISIFCCDILIINKDAIGAVDAIWDRGGLIAINKSDRERYAQVMLSVMSPRCRYLLETLEYDPLLYGGPPHHTTQEIVRKLFGAQCSIDLLHLRKYEDINPERLKAWNLKVVYVGFTLLISK